MLGDVRIIVVVYIYIYKYDKIQETAFLAIVLNADFDSQSAKSFRNFGEINILVFGSVLVGTVLTFL